MDRLLKWKEEDIQKNMVAARDEKLSEMKFKIIYYCVKIEVIERFVRKLRQR
jgi:hypothetical protein